MNVFAMLGALALAVPLSAGMAAAQGNTLIYGGIGQAGEEALESNAMPFSFGLLLRPATSRMSFGIDIAGEGTMLDSTWGDEALRQAISFNALIGTNLAQNNRFSLDGALLLGMRETFADCPDSYLGFQCYADEAPSTEYDVNYGAVLIGSFDRMAIGLRVTGESTQIVLGTRF